MDILPIFKTLWRHKTAPGLIIAQLALSIAIISNAIFFIQDRNQLISRPSGLASEDIATVWIKQKPGLEFNQEEVSNDLHVIHNYDGVKVSAPFGQSIPFSHRGGSSGFSRQRYTDENYQYQSGAFVTTDHRAISALGLKLLSGRNFYPEEIHYYKHSDPPESASAIITQSLANQLFPNESPLNQIIYLAGYLPLTVVGVVDDFLGYFPSANFAYQSVLVSAIEQREEITYVVRTDLEDPALLIEALSQKLQDIDRQRVIAETKTMSNMISSHYRDDRAMVYLLILIISLLIFVNILGIVGITTFWVNQRRKTIGVRRALGATRWQIQRYFFVESTLLVLIATLLGGFFGTWVSYFFMNTYAIEMLPWYYSVATGLAILIISLAATFSPAHRASSIPPREALSG